MLGSPLGFDVYHLGLYLLTASLWVTLSLALAFKGRLLFPRWGAWSGALAPLAAIAISAVLLVLDVILFLDRSFTLALLLLIGMILPMAMLVGLYARLRASASSNGAPRFKA